MESLSGSPEIDGSAPVQSSPAILSEATPVLESQSSNMSLTTKSTLATAGLSDQTETVPEGEGVDDTPARRFTSSVSLPHGGTNRGAEEESPPPKVPSAVQIFNPASSPEQSASGLKVANHMDPIQSPAAPRGSTDRTLRGEVVTLSSSADAVQGGTILTEGRVLPVSTVPSKVEDSSLSILDVTATELLQESPNRPLPELQQRLRSVRRGIQSQSLSARYLGQNTGPQGDASPLQISSSKGASAHFTTTQIFRSKLILLGYQEVGKTSLRKCFEHEPFFWASLPDVRSTTGIEVHKKRKTVINDKLEVTLSDFAGQEVYHSHTYFLTSRSVFLLVWKISAVEQDLESRGISAPEEERLQVWIAEVLAKFPFARIVLIATHLDELRVQGQRAVDMILNKVERKLCAFIDGIMSTTWAQASAAASTAAGGGPVITGASSLSKVNSSQKVIVGNFAVSCKSRNIIASGNAPRSLSGKTIGALFGYLCSVAKEGCLADREYPLATFPVRHEMLMAEVEKAKKEHPHNLTMKIAELVRLAISVGIDSEDELMQVARLMHSWDQLYLFNQYSLGKNSEVLLKPRWLNDMAASLFSYAHLLRTPLHKRSMIGGLKYSVSYAEKADLSMMSKGYLRVPLARILFHHPLSELLERTPHDADVGMCLSLLESMDILYPVELQCDETSLVEEEALIEPTTGRPVITPGKLTRYFIPSLAPFDTPPSLKRLAPLLFHRGVRARFEFNLLPDELWWRLQCKLHEHIKSVVVFHSAVDVPEDEDMLMNGYRLREADAEHNRWRDSLWMGGPICRVLMYREGLNAISLLSAETSVGGSEEVLRAIEDAFDDLLFEYKGIQRRSFVACPSPKCEGWIGAEAVASNVRIVCPTCRGTFDSNDVIIGRSQVESSQFPRELLTEAGELLSSCLTYRSCLYMCGYLGIPYRGPTPDNSADMEGEVAAAVKAENTTDTNGTHIEYLRALDKVVQAELFRFWSKMVNEEAHRRRMLEVSPS